MRLRLEAPVLSAMGGRREPVVEHIQLGDTSVGGPIRYIPLECHARDLPAHATPTVGWPPE